MSRFPVWSRPDLRAPTISPTDPSMNGAAGIAACDADASLVGDYVSRENTREAQDESLTDVLWHWGAGRVSDQSVTPVASPAGSQPNSRPGSRPGSRPASQHGGSMFSGLFGRRVSRDARDSVGEVVRGGTNFDTLASGRGSGSGSQNTSSGGALAGLFSLVGRADRSPVTSPNPSMHNGGAFSAFMRARSGSVHGGSALGGSALGGSAHGGSAHGGSAHGGSAHGGSMQGSVHGSEIWNWAHGRVSANSSLCGSDAASPAASPQPPSLSSRSVSLFSLGGASSQLPGPWLAQLRCKGTAVHGAARRAGSHSPVSRRESRSPQSSVHSGHGTLQAAAASSAPPAQRSSSAHGGTFFSGRVAAAMGARWPNRDTAPRAKSRPSPPPPPPPPPPPASQSPPSPPPPRAAASKECDTSSAQDDAG